MYAYLRGKITVLQPATAIIECHGVGFQVHISLITYSKLQNTENALIYTHLHIKEDSHSIWGFYDELEREIFLHLISVSGIGPNTARMTLNYISPEELQHAILTENVALIQSVKGIGPKTAKRLILELKDKIGKSATISLNIASMAVVDGMPSSRVRVEAVSALVALGFARQIAEQQVMKVMKGNEAIKVEEVIKLTLKNL